MPTCTDCSHRLRRTDDGWKCPACHAAYSLVQQARIPSPDPAPVEVPPEVKDAPYCRPMTPCVDVTRDCATCADRPVDAEEARYRTVIRDAPWMVEAWREDGVEGAYRVLRAIRERVSDGDVDGWRPALAGRVMDEVAT